MAERFRTLVTELNAEFSSKKLLLEKQERHLSEERERLAREVELMQRVEVCNKDIIQLNVGGRHFTTKRGCLRLVEGSVLDLMFSGRWEDRVDRDENGRVFLDYDPDLFTVILRYLVALHTYGMAAEHLELRPIPSHLELEFRLMLDHLGLSEIIQPRRDFRWSQTFKSPGVTIEEDESVVRTGGSRLLRHFVLSHDVFLSGLFNFRMKLRLIEEWVMIGIIREDVLVGQSENVCVKEGVYGFGCDGEVFVNGKESSKDGYPGRKFQTGDEVLLTLDCRFSTLLLTAPVREVDLEYKIPELSGNRWRLLLSTYFGTSKVSVRCN